MQMVQKVARDAILWMKDLVIQLLLIIMMILSRFGSVQFGVCVN